MARSSVDLPVPLRPDVYKRQRPNRLGDHMLSLTAGFTFHFGKVGWKRAVDATPYIRQNEWLVDYADVLSGENKRYKDWHDHNRRALAELKKILEIEGLLDKYGHLVDDDETDSRQGYPMNNYSCLLYTSNPAVLCLIG